MQFFLLLITLGIVQTIDAHSGKVINVPGGQVPSIDGQIAEGEWADAASISFATRVTVYMKVNGDNLFTAFKIIDSTVNNDFGDISFIMFDVGHNANLNGDVQYLTLRAQPNNNPLKRKGVVEGGISAFTEYEGPERNFEGKETSHSSFWESELRVGFSEINLSSGGKIGVEFAISDGTGPSPGFYWSGEMTHECQPETWGDLNLTESFIQTPTDKEKITLSGYPNPFNAACYIPANGRCKIYNILGQLVREIENSNLPGSKPQISKSILWDGKDSCGLKVPAGVYFWKLDRKRVKKMVILR